MCPPSKRRCDAGGVLEVGDGVDELGSARPYAAQGLLQRVHAHAALVERHALHPRLVRGERLKSTDVGGPFGDHDVAGVEEDLRQEVEALLGARGDDDVGGAEPHP
jgi:hypothetical protein